MHESQSRWRLLGLGVCLAVVFAVVIAPGVALADATTYDIDADFDLGVPVGVEHETTPDQLQLSTESVTLPFIWVPNLDGSVSKIHTMTGRELGRYRVGPLGLTLSPSRTTVDLNGCCWVGNRQAGTVVKIGLAEAGYWVDRNGNGVCDTSADLNDDGRILGAEVLPWGQDEAVLAEVVLAPGAEMTFPPGVAHGKYFNDYWLPGPRSLAVAADNDFYVGCYGTRMFYEIDGTTSMIKRRFPAGHSPYGAVIDREGIIWSASLYGPLTRIDPTVDPPNITQIPMPDASYCYGVALDNSGHVLVSGDSRLRAYNKTTGVWDWNVSVGGWFYRGVAVDATGDIWVADTSLGRVDRFSSAGALKAHIPVPGDPTGVAVDSAGKVWACILSNDNVVRIDPASNVIDYVYPVLGSGGHYSYSDMTGFVARNTTTKLGTWTVVTDSGEAASPWVSVSWNGFAPEGGALAVRVRSSEDGVAWSAWDDVISGEQPSVPAGRYLQTEVKLVAAPGDASPVLFDLTVDAETNDPPSIAADATACSCIEGSDACMTGTFSDPDGDPVVLSASSGAIVDCGGGVWKWTKGEAEGPFTDPVTVMATDSSGESASADFEVKVANADPDCSAMVGPADPVRIGLPVTLTQPFTDAGTGDTHVVVFDWGDGSTSAGTVGEADGCGSGCGTHTYAVPDVYTITATVTDDDGGSSTQVFRYVVAYDPTGGFVTGGGTIMSPAGAYRPDASLEGKANFGFVSKYLKGASTPSGNTEFVFHAGSMSFHSSSYEWLVIAGPKAQYKGTGTVDGMGAYRFILTAVDGQVTGGGGVDRFRIKIWDPDTGDILYDNELGSDDTALPTTPIAGGSIVVHKAK